MPVDEPSRYGDAFARVYDDWYHDISDVDATVATATELAAGGPILELGVGTGRIALPLAQADHRVTGLDSSAAMLTECQAKEGTDKIQIVRADMAHIPFTRGFALVLVTFNTLFNLTNASDQDSCIKDIASTLMPSGSLLVEAFVPNHDPGRVEYVETSRSDRAGGHIMTTSTRDPETQIVRGVHIHTPAAGPIARLPWAIRYLYPRQLDEMCARNSLELCARWSDWAGTPFDADSSHHVSHYRVA